MNTNNRILALVAASALALSGCATTAPGYGYGTGPAPSGSMANCFDCGVVTRIEQVGTGTTGVGVTGAVVGGLVGAAAGRKLTDDESKGRQNTATVAGAVAGAAAGAAVQRNMTGAGVSYNVYVRMNDGRTTVVSQSALGGVREGSAVRVYNGRAWVR